MGNYDNYLLVAIERDRPMLIPLLFYDICTMLVIYDASGVKRFETPINIGSKRVFKLMGDDYITLKFSVKEPIYFELGDYCDVDLWGRFVLVEPYQPSYNEATGGYDYEIQLDAQHIKWRNKIHKYLPQFGGQECSWVLTATPDVHLEQITHSINALANGSEYDAKGYLYNGVTEWIFFIDDSVDRSAKTISYENVNILDALTQIAETYECEWWINGNIVNLGKCELNNDYIDFELGNNVESMSRSDSTEDYVTRVIPFGSERNISPRYRKELIFDVTELKYIDNYNGDSNYEVYYLKDKFRPLKADCFPPENQKLNEVNHIAISGYPTPGDTFVKAFTFQNDATTTSQFVQEYSMRGMAAIEANRRRWKVDLKNARMRILSINQNAISIIGRVVFTVTINSQVWVENEQTGKGSFKTREPVVMVADASRYNGSAPGISSNPVTYFEATFNQDFEVDGVITSIDLEIEVNGTRYTTSQFFQFYCNLSSFGVDVVNNDSGPSAENLTLELLDENGGAIGNGMPATFNPDFEYLEADANWFRIVRFKGDSPIEVGDHFRVRPILLHKVKSSYFSSKYTKYVDAKNVIVNGVVASRLMLPESHGLPYIDLVEGQTTEEGVEDVVIFEDVYPKARCAVREVLTEDAKQEVQNDDGTTSYQNYTIYSIRDDFFTADHPFDIDYRIPNVKTQITFLEGKKYEEGDEIPDGKHIGDYINENGGKLNGWTFDVEFSNDKENGTTWKILRDENANVPNEFVHPEEGDTFVIVGIDTSIIDDRYVDAAEQELLKKAKAYVEKINIDPSTYECTMMSDEVKGEESVAILKYAQPGLRVNLLNDAYMPVTIDADGKRWGRKSRIIGIEAQLDIPYDSPIYTVGEKAQYSKFGEISDKLNAMNLSVAGVKYGVSTIGTAGTGNGTGVYVVGQNDSTPESDTNVYSSLRSRSEFLSKTENDSARGRINFTAGLDAADATIEKSLNAGDKVDFNSGYVEGQHGGRIWVDESGELHFATDYLEIHKKLSAKEVEVQRQTHVGGAQISSPASMVCIRVENVDDGYKCFFLASGGDGLKIYNDFCVDDLARCETFNIQAQSNGTVGNRYYWRRVIETGTTEDGAEHYIILGDSDDDKDKNSNIPMEGDHIVTMGNRSIPARQSLIITSSYGAGSPYIYQFKDINTFSLPDSKARTKLSPQGNRISGELIVEAEGVSTPLRDYVDGSTPYSLVAVPPVVLMSERGAFKPAVVSCEVYFAAGTERCRRVKLRPGEGEDATGLVMAGEVLVVDEAGELVLATIGEDDPERPAGLELRQVVVSDDGAGGYATGEETPSSGVVFPQEDMRSVEFRLYQDGKLIATAGVNIQADSTALATSTSTRFTQTDKEISAVATRVSEYATRTETLESELKVQADNISQAVRVDGETRAGLTLDAVEGITMEADKVRIKNGDTLTALFTDGILNAALIVASKLITRSTDGKNRITVSEFDDNFIRFYHDDGVTVACKMGLERISLNGGVATVDEISAQADEAETEGTAILQCFDDIGRLSWALCLTGPVAPDLSRYYWRTYSLRRPSEMFEGSESSDSLGGTTLLPATGGQYWMLKDSKADTAGAGDFDYYVDRLYTQKLSNAAMSSGIRPSTAPAGAYYSPEPHLKRDGSGVWVYDRYTVDSEGHLSEPTEVRLMGN